MLRPNPTQSEIKNEQTSSDSANLRLDKMEEMIQKMLLQQQTTQNNLCELGGMIQKINHGLSSSSPTVAAETTEAPNSAPVMDKPSPHQLLVKPSEFFSGDATRCSSFLLQCKLAFCGAPKLFTSSVEKISYFVTQLTGDALLWATSYLEIHDLNVVSYGQFLSEFRRIFDHPLQEANAVKRLLNLRQGGRPASDHALRFRLLAAQTKWNDAALRGTYLHSLSEYVKDQLAARDEPETFDELVKLSICLDERHSERRREQNYKFQKPRASGNTSSSGERRTNPARPAVTTNPQFIPSTWSPSAGESKSNMLALPEPEPMIIGRAHLTPEEKRRRRDADLCIYCGSSGHYVRTCPLQGNEDAHQ